MKTEEKDLDYSDDDYESILLEIMDIERRYGVSISVGKIVRKTEEWE